MNLLEKLRFLFERHVDSTPNFKNIAKNLGTVFECNVFIVDVKGTFLGTFSPNPIKCELVRKMLQQGSLDSGSLLRINEHQHGTAIASCGSKVCFVNYEGNKCVYKNKQVYEVPIIVYGKRIGTMIFSRGERAFTDEDTTLFEVIAIILGMEMLYEEEKQQRVAEIKKLQIDNFINSLSTSEKRAFKVIIAEMGGLTEKQAVTAKIAERAGMGPTLLNVVLKKMKGAGLAEIASMGAAGTYVKILNEDLLLVK